MKRIFTVTVWFVAVFGLWRLLQTEAMYDALLKFVAAGELPVTHRVITPNEAVWIGAGVLLLGIGLVFHAELLRELRQIKASFGWRAYKQQQGHATELLLVPASPSVSTPKQRRLKTPKPKPVIIITVPGRQGVLNKAAHRAVPRIGSAVTTASSWGYYRAGVVLRAVIRAARIAARIALLLAKAAWRWIEPHVRQFDHWLEVTLKRNPNIARALQTGANTIDAVRAQVIATRRWLAATTEKARHEVL